jgi:hypothetical protein
LAGVSEKKLHEFRRCSNLTVSSLDGAEQACDSAALRGTGKPIFCMRYRVRGQA